VYESKIETLQRVHFHARTVLGTFALKETLNTKHQKREKTFEKEEVAFAES